MSGGGFEGEKERACKNAFQKGAAVIRIEDAAVAKAAAKPAEKPVGAASAMPGIAANVAPGFDAGGILRGVGEAAYEWQLGTDTISWSDGAPALLGADAAPVSYTHLTLPTILRV